MNDNEKLIEEAARAMANGEHITLGWHGHSEDEQDWYRKDAAIALAVFEKAHIPTGDEREALANEAWREYRAEHGYTTHPTQPDTGADFYAGFEAGLRRSAEPSIDKRECGFLGCGSPRCEAMCSPEPQGEPSDAEVREVIRQAIRGRGEGEVYADTLAGVIARALAALRAAGGVR